MAGAYDQMDDGMEEDDEQQMIAEMQREQEYAERDQHRDNGEPYNPLRYNRH